MESKSKKETKTTVGEKSKNLLFTRHCKEIEELFNEMEFEAETEITEVQLVELMIRLGYVRMDNNEDIDAVNSFWAHIRPVREEQKGQREDDEEDGQEQFYIETVQIKNVIVILSAISGFHYGEQAQTSNKDGTGLLGSIDHETMTVMLSKAEVNKLHRRFQ